MKKLMIAAAIVCAVAFVQASSVDWKLGTAFKPGTSTEIETGDGYYAFFVLDSVTAGSNDTYSRDSALTDIGNGSVDFLSHKSGMKEIDLGAKASVDLSLNNVAKGYLVILDSDTIADATLAYISDLKTVNLSDIGPDNSFNFGNLTDTKVADNWKAVNVPEPTSGLLLLLGVAGLALKRRRA